MLAICDGVVYAELLQSELERHHTAQADQLTRNHAQQMQAARMELERVVELSKLKVVPRCHAITCHYLLFGVVQCLHSKISLQTVGYSGWTKHFSAVTHVLKASVNLRQNRF